MTKLLKQMSPQRGGEGGRRGSSYAMSWNTDHNSYSDNPAPQDKRRSAIKYIFNMDPL